LSPPSKADIARCQADVRFTPKSGHWKYSGRRRSIAWITIRSGHCGAPREDVHNAHRIIGQRQGWITGSSRLLRAARFCRRWLLLFWGRRLFTVTSWARNGNRAPADAPVELILLRLGVYGGLWMRMPLMIFTTIVTSFRV
jgi:hypothetical protein